MIIHSTWELIDLIYVGIRANEWLRFGCGQSVIPPCPCYNIRLPPLGHNDYDEHAGH